MKKLFKCKNCGQIQYSGDFCFECFSPNIVPIPDFPEAEWKEKKSEEKQITDDDWYFISGAYLND